MSFDYGFMFDSKITLFSYIALMLSIVSLWYKKNKIISGGLLVLAVLTALLSHRVVWQGLLFIVIFGGTSYLAFNSKHKLIRIIGSSFMFIGSILLWFHWIPGFYNWQVAKGIQTSPEAMPFNLFINFDKPLIGLFILGFSGIPLLSNWKSWRHMLLIALPVGLIGSLLIAGIACLVGYIKFDPKMNTFFILWGLNNLLFVCVAEEVFFRGWNPGHAG